MQVIVTGVHQRTAPLWMRERLAFDAATLPSALHTLRRHIPEAIIISTCNRTEICAVVGDETGDIAHIHNFLAAHSQTAVAELAPHLYTFTGAEAVRHIFRLAAGLDSTVIGEDQIMLQIKAAHAAARAAGTLGKTLHRLLHHALAAGKRVRTQTQIAGQHVSVVSVALDLARQQVGPLHDKHIVIVGAGHVAELVLKHLKDHDMRAVTVVNRNADRGMELASYYGAQFQPLVLLEASIMAADVVISCTTASQVVITAAMLAPAVAAHTTLLLLDLAMPRDIDPACATLDGVRLCDIDTIQAISNANRAARADEITHAEALVANEVSAYMDWWVAQEIVPTIQALRARAEAIRATELQRTLARLPDLTPQAQAAINALSAAIVNKLLHEPIIALKDPSAGGELAPALRRLFHLADSTERETHVVES